MAYDDSIYIKENQTKILENNEKYLNQ